MKFGVAVTTSVNPAVTGPAQADYVSRVASAAEDAGYDSVWVSDRTVFPVDLAERYPEMYGPGRPRRAERPRGADDPELRRGRHAQDAARRQRPGPALPQPRPEREDGHDTGRPVRRTSHIWGWHRVDAGGIRGHGGLQDRPRRCNRRAHRDLQASVHRRGRRVSRPALPNLRNGFFPQAYPETHPPIWGAAIRGPPYDGPHGSATTGTVYA